MATSTNITSLIKLSMCELQHAITWNWLTLTRSSCRCSIPESLKILRKQKTSVKWIHGRERFLLWELRDVTSGSWICERIINAEGLGATVCFRKWQQKHLQPFAAAADSQTWWKTSQMLSSHMWRAVGAGFKQGCMEPFTIKLVLFILQAASRRTTTSSSRTSPASGSKVLWTTRTRTARSSPTPSYARFKTTTHTHTHTLFTFPRDGWGYIWTEASEGLGGVLPLLLQPFVMPPPPFFRRLLHLLSLVSLFC